MCRPRLEPVDDTLAHVRRALVDGRRPDEEEHDEYRDELEAGGRRVEDREEDPVVEERAAEVVGREENEHRAAPDDEQRAPVLDAPLREHLPLLAEVRGEEDDERDLPELARLELQPAEVDPQAGAVHRLADAGQERHEQERDGAETEEVLVVLEQPVVAPQPDERGGEDGDADHHPEALLERVRRPEPVDLGQPDGGQQPGDRQEVRVGVRHGEPGDDVRREVEREEEDRVRERRSGDMRLPRDVDARESDRSDDPDDDEIGELAIPVAQGQRISPQTSSDTSTATAKSTKRTRRARAGAGFHGAAPACEPCVLDADVLPRLSGIGEDDRLHRLRVSPSVGAAVGADAERDDGDVVLAAAAVRGRDEQLRHLVEVVVVVLDDVEDVLVVHHRGQPVGADEEDVAVARVDDERVDVDVGIGSDGAGDDGALRMRLRLLRRELAALQELVDERVVVGELLDPAVADAVRARVADVADDDALALDERDGHRRSHARRRRVDARALVHAAVRLLDERRDPRGAGEPAGIGVLERGGRELRRDLAALRAAHAVGDGEERRRDDVRVLVPAPLPAGVRPARVRADLRHSSNLRSVSPTRTTSPGASLRASEMRTPFTYVPFVEPRS